MGYTRTSLGADGDKNDFALVLSAQRNEARRVFGQTSIPLTGRTDINYPNVSGAYALRLIDYWSANATRVHAKADSLFSINTAVKAQWLRAFNMFMSEFGPIPVIERAARAAGANIINPNLAKILWDQLDGIVLGMRGINESPSHWDLLKEAFSERVSELTGSASAGLLKLAIIGGVFFLGYTALFGRRDT